MIKNIGSQIGVIVEKRWAEKDFIGKYEFEYKEKTCIRSLELTWSSSLEWEQLRRLSIEELRRSDIIRNFW